MRTHTLWNHVSFTGKPNARTHTHTSSASLAVLSLHYKKGTPTSSLCPAWMWCVCVGGRCGYEKVAELYIGKSSNSRKNEKQRCSSRAIGLNAFIQQQHDNVDTQENKASE